MNFASIAPHPVYRSMSRPVKMTPNGNMYKVSVSHMGENGVAAPNHEIWMTKEAVQKHFGNTTEDPKKYQLMQFAKSMYDKHLYAKAGQSSHNGLLVTTDGITHGNTKLWPHTLVHPEVKF